MAQFFGRAFLILEYLTGWLIWFALMMLPGVAFFGTLYGLREYADVHHWSVWMWPIVLGSPFLIAALTYFGTKQAAKYIATGEPPNIKW